MRNFFTLLFITAVSIGAMAQCDNTGQPYYPATPFSFPIPGTSDIIFNVPNGFGVSQITNVEAFQSVVIQNANSSTLMTVRSGTSDGPVVAGGTTTFQFIPSTNEDLFVHYNLFGCSIDPLGANMVTIINLGYPDCQNTTFYPPMAIDLDISGVSQVLAPDYYAGSDYSQLTNVLANATYTIEMESGAYITVREGSVGGTILSAGDSILTFTTTSNSDLFVHFTVDEYCNTDNTGAYTATIERQACSSAVLWPEQDFVLGNSGEVETIAYNYLPAYDYTIITNVLAAGSYNLVHSAGSFLTVKNHNTGEVIAGGYSPLDFVAPTSDDVEVHINTDPLCGLDIAGGANYTMTVQLAVCDDLSSYTQFPLITTSAGLPGDTVLITDNAYDSGEYSVVTNVAPQLIYEFIHDFGSYGAIFNSNGQLLAGGPSPVSVITQDSSDLTILWTTDGCSSSSDGSFSTYVVTNPFQPCINVELYPNNQVDCSTVINPGDSLLIGSFFHPGGEYSVLTSLIQGTTYELSHENGAFITVRGGAVDGPVVASGYSPLSFSTSVDTLHYVHWNTDDICGIFTVPGSANYDGYIYIPDPNASCSVDAGSSAAVSSNVCLSGGSATVAATPDGNALIPTGYELIYLLGTGSDTLITQTNTTGSFNVTATGDYSIHTLVYDPNQVDPAVLLSSGMFNLQNVQNYITNFGLCATVDDIGSSITVDICTGMTNAERADMTVYPNPNNGQFTLQGSWIGGEATCEIYNMYGQVVYSTIEQVKGEFKMHLQPDLAPGRYLLRLYTESVSLTETLVVE